MILKGLTWNKHWHADTLAALTQMYEMSHPDTQIQWEYSSLLEYEKALFSANINHYDMVLIKNLHMESIVSMGTLLPLESIMDKNELSDISIQAIGASYMAYHDGSHQYCLPQVVTSLVAAYRSDLLENSQLREPKTWNDVLELAKALPDYQKVAMALKPSNLYDIFRCMVGFTDVSHIYRDTVDKTLGFLEELVTYLNPQCFEMSMLDIYRKMSSGNEIVYVPMIIGNANYSKDGYRKYLIDFTNAPVYLEDQKPTSIFYGSGIGITRRSEQIDEAASFISYISSRTIQDTMIIDFDGHTIYEDMWLNKSNNQKVNHYFSQTYETQRNAISRRELTGNNRKWLMMGTVIWEYLRYRNAKRDSLVTELTHLLNDYENDVIWT